jgi:hypothetical protein
LGERAGGWEEELDAVEGVAELGVLRLVLVLVLVLALVLDCVWQFESRWALIQNFGTCFSQTGLVGRFGKVSRRGRVRLYGTRTS